MGDFKKGGFSGGKRFGGPRHGGGKPPFARKGGFAGRDRDTVGGDRPLFKATCADCGNSCEVPFRPSGDRPVFCNNCFGGNDRAPQKREFSRPAFTPAIKPQPAVVDNRIEEVKKQLDVLHKKVDSLVRMMEAATAPVAAPAVVVKEVVPVKVKAAKKAPAKKVAKKKAK